MDVEQEKRNLFERAKRQILSASEEIAGDRLDVSIIITRLEVAINLLMMMGNPPKRLSWEN